MEVCHRIAWELGTSQAKCTAEGEEAGENRNFVCKEIEGTSGCSDDPLTMKYTCETIFKDAWALGGRCSDVTFDLAETRKFYIRQVMRLCNALYVKCHDMGRRRILPGAGASSVTPNSN